MLNVSFKKLSALPGLLRELAAHARILLLAESLHYTNYSCVGPAQSPVAVPSLINVSSVGAVLRYSKSCTLSQSGLCGSLPASQFLPQTNFFSATQTIETYSLLLVAIWDLSILDFLVESVIRLYGFGSFGPQKSLF